MVYGVSPKLLITEPFIQGPFLATTSTESTLETILWTNFLKTSFTSFFIHKLTLPIFKIGL